jgi:UDPglucose 6-dehydrogenase
MTICVYGLWHLGSVTAGCLSTHFTVIGLDPDPEVVEGLSRGLPPISEPGLPELISENVAAGKLSFTSDVNAAVRNADIVWVTFDTPVDENDIADVEFVENRVRAIFPCLRNDSMVLVSSQVPVGFSAKIENAFKAVADGRRVGFAYSPENLRLGKALDAFRKPERIIAGARCEGDQQKLLPMLAPFSSRIEWMSVESAEMTKHALNAFLATSVTFINEIATLCERVGADAKEVERGLKSELRIGPRAYLGPGSAFAGGTLARDVAFLGQIGVRVNLPTPFFNSILESNDLHKGWLRRKLVETVGSLSGKTIAVLGLTYKPGTNTLRRSSAVELCQWAAKEGAVVQAFDPAIQELPGELQSVISLCGTALDAASGADSIILATEWPEFRSISADDLVVRARRPLLLDPNRFVVATLGSDPRIEYEAVGMPGKR